MNYVVTQAKRLSGTIKPPGDKSITHRAILFNAIAQGKAKVLGYSRGADCMSTMACLRTLGASIQEANGHLLIQGQGLHGLRESANVLDAGNSGTTIRLLAGVLAAQPFLSIITGDQSLRSRPMDRVIRPLQLMGAHIHGREGDRYAPLVIQGGPLRGIRYPMPVASAQVKSALLLAGLYAEGETVVEEPVSSRDHTERMLKAMGASVTIDGPVIQVRPGSLKSMDVSVPGDISAAAFWLVLGAIHPAARIQIRNVGLNPTRAGILDVLQGMGARIRILNQRVQGGEPVADLEVESSALKGVDASGALIPRLIDEVPVLALAACVADGVTTIRDAAELRVKESDRIRTTVTELSRLGATIEELPDGMRIRGGAKLVGARCHSYGDHRLAMTLAVAGLVSQGATTIQEADAVAVAVSYPDFWSHLEGLQQA